MPSLDDTPDVKTSHSTAPAHVWNLPAAFNRAAFMGSLTIVNMAAAAAAPASTGGIGPIISVIAAGLTGYTAIRKFAEGLQEPITAPVPAAPRP